jgi:tetratricopeptide (TPR) repeat protein
MWWLLLLFTAFAQPTEDELTRAKELYANGETLYSEGDYENALVAFEAAYDLAPAPLLNFNMANTLERLGRFKEALDKLSAYRAFAPADERETLERRIRNMERRIEEQPHLEPDPVPNPKPVVVPVPVPVPIPVPVPDPVLEKRPFPVLPVSGYGVGGLGLVVGTVYGSRVLGVRKNLMTTCVDSLCMDSAGTDLQADKSLSMAADIGWILGGVGVAVGTVGLVLGKKKDASVVTNLSAGPGSLSLRGRF